MRSSLRRVLIGLAVVAVFVVGALSALGVRSLVAGTASASPQVPNPGHGYSQIELPAGTWTDLDADLLDGLSSDQIHDADDHVADADYATDAGYATSAQSASSAGYATSAGDADTLDGVHANQIHDADDHVAGADYATDAGYATSAGSASSASSADYATDAGNADTVDGQHASELLGVTEIQGVAIDHGAMWTVGPPGGIIGQWFPLVETTVNLSSAGRLDYMLDCQLGETYAESFQPPYARVLVNGQESCLRVCGFFVEEWNQVCSARDIPLNAGSNVVRIEVFVNGCNWECTVAAVCNLFGVAHSP